MTMVHRANAESVPAPTELSSGSAADAGGGFKRLNPVDGLFLRAEHLSVMQKYAADLAAAVGAGLGPGVAYGYTCTLSGDTVEVGGGLAFADGRPLHSTQSASVSLKDLTASESDFWIVEIVSKTWPFGSEPVYGGLCEDPCGHGSGIRPYEAEGVELRLTYGSFVDQKPGGVSLRRNRLASYYFERERRYGGELASSPNAPWLFPVSASGPVLPLKTYMWREGSGPHDYAAVPLGVVWKEGDQWRIDTWIARRDLGDPTPSAAWQWRLGWRPRNVFVAQVLQFQAQLAASPFGTAAASPDVLKLLKAEAEPHLKLLRQFARFARNSEVPQVADTAARSVDAVLAYSLLGDPGTSSLLYAAGFDELPPAGYLPFDPGTPDDMDTRAKQIFGQNVDVQVRVCRADFIAHAVEQVQHMDRIPLTPSIPIPRVDLLVPEAALVDLAATKPADTYGWAAFVRRREEEEVVPGPAQQDVDVYIVRTDAAELVRHLNAIGTEQAGKVLKEILRRSGGDQTFTFVGTTKYPTDTWALPIDTREAWEMVRGKLSVDETIVGALGVVGLVERLPLAAVRASLFVTPVKDVNNVPVGILPTYVLAADAPETIVVFLAPVQEGPVIK